MIYFSLSLDKMSIGLLSLVYHKQNGITSIREYKTQHERLTAFRGYKMKKTNKTVDEKYNEPFAVRMRELLEISPKKYKLLEISPETYGKTTKETADYVKTTYKELADYLEVKQQSVSSWVNGITVPDTKHIVPIAEYFGVSCDYLLTGIKHEYIDVHAKTGLSNTSIERFEKFKGSGLYDDNTLNYCIERGLFFRMLRTITECIKLKEDVETAKTYNDFYFDRPNMGDYADYFEYEDALDDLSAKAAGKDDIDDQVCLLQQFKLINMLKDCIDTAISDLWLNKEVEIEDDEGEANDGEH